MVACTMLWRWLLLVVTVGGGEGMIRTFTFHVADDKLKLEMVAVRNGPSSVMCLLQALTETRDLKSSELNVVRCSCIKNGMERVKIWKQRKIPRKIIKTNENVQTGNDRKEEPINRKQVSKNGKCEKKGMNYAPKQKQCVKGCSKFGTTMSMYKGIGLDAHNDKRIIDLTLQDCIRECVTLKEFTCKSFDFGRELGLAVAPYVCYLSKAGYFDVPINERSHSKAWIFGVRNCED